MSKTVAEMLDWLEKPENEEQIKNLAHLENLKYVEDVKKIKGLGGILARFALYFTKNHMDALIALSECKSQDDIAAFKQTKHFEKIKNISIGDGWGNLNELKELEELKDLEKHIQ